MKNELYEKIWTLFKFMISDYIDLIADKSLDFIIVLCLFLTLYSFEDKFDLFENKIEGNYNFTITNNYKTIYLFHLINPQALLINT